MKPLSLAWQPADFNLAVLLLGATLIYVLYHYFLNARFWAARFPDTSQAQTQSVWIQNFGGGFFLGLSALAMSLYLGYDPLHLGLNMNSPLFSLLSGLGLFALLAPMLYFAGKNPGQYALYPMIRHREWTGKDFGLYLLSWAVYLLGYEFFFRGFLLFALAQIYGGWSAIMITTALYVVVHLPKMPGETIGCIPIGLWWGWSALYSGSILGPFLAHTLIACSTQYFCLKHHPEMGFKKTNALSADQ